MKKLSPDGSVSRPRKPTNVSLPDALVREARDLRVNVSQAHRSRWQEENREANGLPLAGFRQF